MSRPPASPPLRRTRALRWHLLLLVSGALLPVAVFAAIVVQQLGNVEQAAAERRLSQSARDLAAVLDREILGTTRALSALAESERLDRGDLRAFHAEARRVQRTQPSWLTVLLLSPAGRQLVNSAQPWGTPLPPANELASLRRTVETRRPVVGDLARGRLGRLAFPVRVPVLRDGRVRYVLTAAIAPGALQGLVAHKLTADEEWTRTLVDGRGVVVARSRTPERFVGHEGTPSFLRNLRQADERLYRETTLDGESVYLAFSRAPLSGWTALIAVPREAVERPVRHSILLIAGIGLSLLAVTGSVSLVFSRRLARSIESAAAAADTLALGKRPYIEPSPVAEVAHLAQALERSADLLGAREREVGEHMVRIEAARADAEAANRAKDEFLAMLGHELRNPLGPIRNGVYLLRELIPNDAKVARIYRMVERQLGHITRLVDDLLDASRITRGKVVLRLEILDLRLIVDQVREDLENQFEAARIALSVATPETPVWIEGDRTRMAQCLGNLLHNALKFTPADGRVSLTLTTGEERASLSVEDNGQGIDPALLPRLFQPFAQGPQPLDRSQGGLGLGLVLVKGLVELQGGEVRVSSDGLGKGSLFTLLLPTTPSPLSVK
jgi:signal transduction histidine kinase